MANCNSFRAAFFFLVSGVCCAQAQPEKITSSTRLVTVPVVVTENGKPLLDLTLADFEIEQDKKVVTISNFELIRPAQKLPNEIRLQSAATPSTSSKPLSPERKPYQSLTVIAVDLLNTKFFRQKEGQRAILDFLEEGLVEQPTALVVFSRKGVRVVSDFSTDMNALKADIAKFKAEFSGTRAVGDIVGNQTENRDSLFGPDMAAPAGNGFKTANILEAMKQDAIAEEKLAKFDQNENARITLKSFEILATALGKLPGRKSLVWFSSSMPFPADYKKYPGTEMGDVYSRVLKELNDSSVSVYSVHLKGLEVASPEADVSISKYQRAIGTNFDAWYYRPKSLIDTARDISQKTGGIAFFNTNDFAKALRESLDDGSTYYMLSYYLKPEQAQPGWHSLKVRVKRKDVKLRSRSGFLLPKAQ